MRASSWARTTTWRARSVKRSNTIRSFSFGVQQARELARVFVRIGSFAEPQDIPRLRRVRHGASLAMGLGWNGASKCALCGLARRLGRRVSQRREEHYLADRGASREQHHEPVDAD